MQRGVRGAIQVEANDRGAILAAAERLMQAVIEGNRLQSERVAAVFFTVTADLNAVFPAEIRSRIGWSAVPFLCAQEIPVPGSMSRILRVLVLFETEMRQDEISHQYLGAAQALRPDLTDKE